MNLLESNLPLKIIAGIIQYELGARMVCPAGGGNYNGLSAIIQTASNPTLVRKLGTALFWPPPKVHSCILKLEVISKEERPYNDSKRFFRFVRSLFSSSRKALRNALKIALREDFDQERFDAFREAHNVPDSYRAEHLTPDQIANLYLNAVQEKID